MIEDDGAAAVAAGTTSDGGPRSSPGVEKLKRWEDGGAIWQVLFRSGTTVAVSLMTCTANEEVDRLVTDDPAVLEFIGDRRSSDPTA